MADLQITGLNRLAEASIAIDDELAVADVSQTETKKVTVKDLVNAVVTASGTSFLADGAIPGSKIGTLGTDLVDTATIIDNKVTNAKIETSTSATTGIDGGQKLRDGTVTVAKLDSTKFDRGLSVASAKLGIANSITAGTKSGITYTAQGLISGVADLVATDLPEATSSAIGAVKVESGSLLEVSNTGAIDIKDVSGLSAGTYASVTVNAKGQVTAGSASASATNIPTATASAKGGVIVPASGGMAVDVSGNLSIATQGSVSAGSYAKVTVNTKGIVTGTGTLADTDIPDHSAAKLTSGTIPAARIGTSAINADRLDTGAVTNDKVETSTSNSTGLDGASKLRDGTITAAKLNTSNIDRSLNVSGGNLGINNTVTAATRSGISYNAQGLITGTVALAAADLPVATTSVVGGVSVSTGLTVNGAGALSLTNSVTAATVSGITFNAQGMITAATALVAGDLPTATTSAKGAVQITSGGGLTVDGSGNLSTSTSGISAGTYQSITVDAKGIATAGAALTAALIPNLAASKITSGTIDAARIGADTIDGSKLSNASTALFQSIAQSGYPTAQFSGQILFDTVSEDAFIWDGNAWQAITTLTKGSLVFGGTYNANTSQMAATTSAGIAAGLAVGSNLPTPSATTDGVYVVVSTAGTPSAPAPAIAFAPPDYILGVTNSAGSSWNEVDLSQTVAGQVASNITFSPYGQLSATNVQDALQELETEKLALAGGTVTGQVLIGNAGSLVFEGSTVDAFETTLTVADPTTSDKTITLPNVTGTVITSGDTNTVTSTMVDASLVNANLAATAAIAFSKLAALTSAQILVGNGSNVATAVAVTGDISIDNAGLTAITAGAIVNADISGSAAITGSKVTTGTTSAVGVLQLTDSTSSTSATTAATPNAVKSAYDLANTANTTANAAVEKTGDTMTGNLIIDNAKEIRFSEADSNGANYLGLKAPDSVTADITWTLPATDSTGTQFLKSDGSGNLGWATDSTTDNTKMPLTGGAFTGDVIFDGATAGRDITFDRSANSLIFANEAKAQFGTTTLFHNSTDLYIQNGVGDIRLEVESGAPGLWMHRDGSIELYDGNAAGTPQKKLETTSSGITVTGGITATGNADITGTLVAGTIDLGDSNKIKLGASDLYEIYCDSANLILDQTADGQTTFIRSKQNGNVTFDASDTGNQVAAKFKWSNDSTPVSSAELYQGGNKKLETTSTGITVTGTVVATAFTGDVTGDLTGDVSGSAATVTGAAQSAITSVGTLTGLTVSGNILMSGNGAIDVAAGTDAQRPGSPNAGMFRFNTDDNKFEGYDGSAWGEIGGGGGGGGATGGGTDTIFVENTLVVTTDYTIGNNGTTNKSAMSVGPITINATKTVNVPTGHRWIVM